MDILHVVKKEIHVNTLDKHHIYWVLLRTGERPKDFTEVTMIALKKKTQATKCSDHCTISLIAHIAKIIAKILRRRTERKIEDALEKISLDLEEEKELGM